jgi:hypothetical protein
MGLSGTTNDLALPELLQMTALSGKSGVLEIRAPQATIWLGIRGGEVVRVARSDGSLDRKQLLLAAGLAPAAPPNATEPVVQEAAVGALLELFGWQSASFSFDAEADPFGTWEGPPGVRVPEPISPQFLALEGMRLGDERDAEEARPAVAAESLPVGPPPPSVIAIDRDLELLELVKRALASGQLPVHILQSSADALARFKQYLLRGIVPALVLGDGAYDPVTPGAEAAGARGFARRARSLAARTRVVLIGGSAPPLGAAPDPVLARPGSLDPAGDDARDFTARLRQCLGLASSEAGARR